MAPHGVSHDRGFLDLFVYFGVQFLFLVCVGYLGPVAPPFAPPGPACYCNVLKR